MAFTSGAANGAEERLERLVKLQERANELLERIHEALRSGGAPPAGQFSRPTPAPLPARTVAKKR